MAGHGCLVVAVRAEESAVFQSLGRLLLLRTTLVAISYPKKKKVNTWRAKKTIKSYRKKLKHFGLRRQVEADHLISDLSQCPSWATTPRLVPFSWVPFRSESWLRIWKLEFRMGAPRSRFTSPFVTLLQLHTCCCLVGNKNDDCRQIRGINQNSSRDDNKPDNKKISQDELRGQHVMKRRNVMDGKPRRPVKRPTTSSKIGENFYGRWEICV